MSTLSPEAEQPQMMKNSDSKTHETKSGDPESVKRAEAASNELEKKISAGPSSPHALLAFDAADPAATTMPTALQTMAAATAETKTLPEDKHHVLPRSFASAPSDKSSRRPLEGAHSVSSRDVVASSLFPGRRVSEPPSASPFASKTSTFMGKTWNKVDGLIPHAKNSTDFLPPGALLLSTPTLTIVSCTGRIDAVGAHHYMFEAQLSYKGAVVRDSLVFSRKQVLELHANISVQGMVENVRGRFRWGGPKKKAKRKKLPSDAPESLRVSLMSSDSDPPRAARTLEENDSDREEGEEEDPATSRLHLPTGLIPGARRFGGSSGRMTPPPPSLSLANASVPPQAAATPQESSPPKRRAWGSSHTPSKLRLPKDLFPRLENPGGASVPAPQPVVDDNERRRLKIIQSMQRYLNDLLSRPKTRNSRHVLEFLRLSKMSFSHGKSVDEGWVSLRVNTRALAQVTFHSCRAGRLVCNCACLPATYGHKERMWLVLKPCSWSEDARIPPFAAFFEKPTDVHPAHVLIHDCGFELRKGFSITGRTLHSYLNSQSWIADLKFSSLEDKKRWTKSISETFGSAPSPQSPGDMFPWSAAPGDTEVLPLVDGEDYFAAVAHALESAQFRVMIQGWWITPDVLLKRAEAGDLDDAYWSLAETLRRCVARGVEVCVIMYEAPAIALALHSRWQESRFPAGVRVLRHPFHRIVGKTISSWFWSHHSKVVVVDDDAFGFCGGIDLAWGRYDDAGHVLCDEERARWPGIDYYNPRVLDISHPKSFSEDLLDRAKFPRMPWHDVALQVRGVAAMDLSRHFAMLWNFCLESLRGESGYPDLSDFPALMVPCVGVAPGLMQTEQPASSPRTQSPIAASLQATASSLPANPASAVPETGSPREGAKADAVPAQPGGADEGVFALRAALGSEGVEVRHEPLMVEATPLVSSLDPPARSSAAPAPSSFSKPALLAVQSDSRLLEIAKAEKASGASLLASLSEISSPTAAPVRGLTFNPDPTSFSAASMSSNAFLPHEGLAGGNGAAPDQPPPPSMQRAYVRVLRSLGAWAGGMGATSAMESERASNFAYNAERSIHDTMIQLIDQADRFVYIENQFFVSGLEGDPLIWNRVSEALLQRCVRAHETKQAFRVLIVLPLLPAFEGEVQTADTLRRVMNIQYRSICRGPSSLLEAMKRRGIEDPSEYVYFASLRAWGALTGPEEGRSALVTEMVYVHSKLMIADDKVAIVGSANINDRSLIGYRDTETCLLIRDVDFVEDRSGRKIGKVVGGLRRKLWREHLGVSEEEREEEDEDFDEERVALRSCIEDPTSEKSWKRLQTVARNNTEIFERIFRCVPTDHVRSLNDLKWWSARQPPSEPPAASRGEEEQEGASAPHHPAQEDTKSSGAAPPLGEGLPQWSSASYLEVLPPAAARAHSQSLSRKSTDTPSVPARPSTAPSRRRTLSTTNVDATEEGAAALSRLCGHLVTYPLRFLETAGLEPGFTATAALLGDELYR